MFDIKKVLETFRREFCDPIFLVLLMVEILVAYGYSMFHMTVNIDTLTGHSIIGEGNNYLSQGRFGTTFWCHLLGITQNTDPIATQAVSVLSAFVLAFDGMLFAFIFTSCMKAQKAYTAKIFAMIFVSYPLIAEIWSYPIRDLDLAVGYLECALSVLLILATRENKRNVKYAISTVLMVLVVSGYESLTVVYVFCAVALTWLACRQSKVTFRQVVKRNIDFAVVLVCAIVCKVIIQTVINITVKDFIPGSGDKAIAWKSFEIIKILKELGFRWFHDYVFRAIIYAPIAEYLFFLVLFLVLLIIDAKRKKGKVAIIMGVFTTLALEMLALIQGISSPYRTRQAIAVFIALVAAVIYEASKRKIEKWILVLTGCLIVAQCLYLGHTFATNAARSDEETRVVCDIGKDINMQCDPDKVVVFAGEYHFSKTVEENINISADSLRWKLYSYIYASMKDQPVNEIRQTLPRNKGYTDINSVINWAKTATDYQKMMGVMLAYYGFDYKWASDDERGWYYEAEATAETMPAWPEKGYIKDMGDYYVVNLGKSMKVNE